MRYARLLLLLFVFAPPAGAQVREIEEAGLPQDVADRLIGLFQDEATVRLDGPAGIPADSVVAGNVAAMGGPVTVAGQVRGHLVVVHGDVYLEPGAVVAGDITTLGGEVFGVDEARIGGTLTSYGEGFRYVRRGERGRYVKQDRVDRRLDRDVSFGGSRFAVRVAPGYNRIEGLPIQFGPQIRTGGSNPLRFEALAIWRSEGDVPPAGDEFGYTVRLEQFVGGGRELRVGATARSVVEPVEAWGLTDTENSLATFLFHHDHRDYFERTGWSAFLRATPRNLPLDATLEYRQEDHAVLGIADPWTLFGDDPWRLQPLVAAGDVRMLVGSVELDTRDDPDDPFEGWHVLARWEQGLGGELEVPAAVPDAPGGPDAGAPTIEGPSFDGDFARAFLDLRRYHPVSPGSRLSLRAVAGGAVRAEALPPQFQHALGGAGTLPGYELLSVDCGARAVTARLAGDAASQAFFPYYGCDRFALFQAEYRGSLDLDFGFFDGDEWDDEESWDDDGDPSWAVFFDAGRGWAFGEWDGEGVLQRRDTETRADAGVGLVLDGFGIYAALPLAGDDRELRWFLRLDRRF